MTEIGTVWAFNQRLTVLDVGGGVTYIPEDAIKAAGHDYYDLRLVQTSKGVPLVALYHGMFCEALLGPAWTAVAESISASLRDIANMAVLNTDGKEAKEDEDAEVSE